MKLFNTLNNAMTAAYVEVTCKGADKLGELSDNGKLQRGVTATSAAIALAIASPTAAFAASSACSGQALTKLVDLIDNAAGFAIAIASAGALLCFAIGAALIVFGGDNGPKRGFEWVKNACYGLAVLASAGFIKYVLLNFVSGATGQSGAKDCLNKGNGGGSSIRGS